VSIYFGDHKLDVLRILGNPNKEFYKDTNLYLNYLELGMDLMINSQDHTLAKIIMHSNFPYHPFFGFHNRCFFELDIKDQTINTISKFAEVHLLMEGNEQEQSNQQHFVRNVTSEFATHYHAFKSIIFEVMPSNGYIASVTLFKV
jgi:hypothetical protein